MAVSHVTQRKDLIGCQSCDSKETNLIGCQSHDSKEEIQMVCQSHKYVTQRGTTDSHVPRKKRTRGYQSCDSRE